MVVAGDGKRAAMTLRGPDSSREAHDLNSAGRAPLALSGSQRPLGRIAIHSRDITKENSQHSAAIQRL